MVLLSITFITVGVLNVILAYDGTKIVNYFNSDTFKTIQNHWQPERKSFENAIALILQQDYGYGGMNVYVRKVSDSYKISDGFYFTDNVIHLVLLETYLQELPFIIAPEVTFALALNYLHVTAGLGRMVLNTQYLLLRNQSDVVYAASEQDVNRKSPFSFQQVQDYGELSIIAQDCIVTGYTISSLSGNTVNLGLDTFRVTDCKFTVEIYSADVGSPPVFGPYFSKEQSLILETMLSKPIRAELLPKLQAAVFSYINTSAIFGDKLPQLRFRQNNVFKETSNYMSGIVEKFMKDVIKNSAGILPLKPVEIMWNEACLNGTCGSCIKLKDVTLYGLDTAYSAHIGGPFKLQSPEIAEAIRFSVIQVRGKIYFENETFNEEHSFAVELRDVAVNVEIEVTADTFMLVQRKTQVVGWRSEEFSIVALNILRNQRRALKSFITGYLINEILSNLLVHIQSFTGDSNRNDQHFDKTDAEIAVDEANHPKQHDTKEPQNERPHDEKINNSKTQADPFHSDKTDLDTSINELNTSKNDENKPQNEKENINSQNERDVSDSDKVDLEIPVEELDPPEINGVAEVSNEKEIIYSEKDTDAPQSDKTNSETSAHKLNSPKQDKQHKYSSHSESAEYEQLTVEGNSSKEKMHSVTERLLHPSENEVE